MSYYDFSKVCDKKIEKKNMKKIRRTLKARISVIDGWIHLKFGMVPRGMLIFIQPLPSYGHVIKGFFLVPVKYTFVCCAPTLAVLGSTAHYRVS